MKSKKQYLMCFALVLSMGLLFGPMSGDAKSKVKRKLSSIDQPMEVTVRFGSKESQFRIFRSGKSKWIVSLNQTEKSSQKLAIKKADFRYLTKLFSKIKKPYHNKGLCQRQYAEIKYNGRTKVACLQSQTPTAKASLRIVNLLSALF